MRLVSWLICFRIDMWYELSAIRIQLDQRSLIYVMKGIAPGWKIENGSIAKIFDLDDCPSEYKPALKNKD